MTDFDPAWTCPRCGRRIEPHQGGNLFEEGRQHMHDHVTEDYEMTNQIETVGDFYAIAPEIISTTPTPQANTVLNWAGENFTVQHTFNRASAREVLREFLEDGMPYREALDRLQSLV